MLSWCLYEICICRLFAQPSGQTHHTKMVDGAARMSGEGGLPLLPAPEQSKTEDQTVCGDPALPCSAVLELSPDWTGEPFTYLIVIVAGRAKSRSSWEDWCPLLIWGNGSCKSEGSHLLHMQAGTGEVYAWLSQKHTCELTHDVASMVN